MKLGLLATSLISLKRPMLLALFVCSSPGISVAQSNPSTQPDMATVRRRIAVIITERLGEGVIIVQGVRAQTRTPPSREAVEEIRHYGDAAVPILSAYFKSRNERERFFAVEFMGLLGGRRIIVPLRNVIRRDASPNIRIQALRWLAEQLPSDSALSIIREAANNNIDEKVRKAAKNILENGTVDGLPAVSVPFKKVSPPL